MNGLLLLSLVAGGVLALRFKALGPVMTAGLALLLLLAQWKAAASLWLWLPWLALPLITVAPLRRLALTGPALTLVQKILPPISATEQEALDAGSTWWEAELFAGNPDWNQLLAFPAPRLTPEEQAFLDGPTEILCRMLDDWQITQELRDLPPEVWHYIRSSGFLGMIIPKQYGGLGFSAQAHSAVVGKLASRSPSAAVTVMVPNSLGPAELLLHYGTEAQKHHYLPRLANGTEIPCFALTGPEAGSDAGSIPDYGVVCEGEFEGRTVLGIKLTWEKRYITLGPVSTLLGLAFRLYDPDKLIGQEQDIGITLALIPSGHPGVHIGRRHYPGGQAFMNGPNWGQDVFIPLDWVVGGRDYCGRGWMMLMNCLAAGRAISLPALGTTCAKQAAYYSGMYARVRSQFGIPVGKMEGVEEALARIGNHAYTLEAARRLTGVGLDLGEKPAVIGGILKYQATERMREAINDAMDIHGGKGICQGPRNYLFSAYQAIPIGITVEGANILTRTLIVFGQGAMRCHPYLLREVQAAGLHDRTAALAAFDEAFMQHAAHVLSNLGRALWHNLSLAQTAPSPETPTRRWYRELSRLSASFALTADAALGLLGGELKRKERLSGRFADILSELYLSSAVLKRWEDDGRPEADRPLVDYSLQHSLHTAEKALHAILCNFPNQPLGWLLRRIVFPWGRRMRPPSDALGHEVATLMLKPGASFDRLSEGLFKSQDADDASGALAYAFQLVTDTKTMAAKVRTAKREGLIAFEDTQIALQAGVISAAEADLLQQTRLAVRDVIMVDDFSHAELSGPDASLIPRPPAV